MSDPNSNLTPAAGGSPDQVIPAGPVPLPGTDARALIGALLAAQYRSGKTIRALAEENGRSYGLVYRLLGEVGVAFRPRGRGHRSGGAA